MPHTAAQGGCIGLDQSRYGTHSIRRAKATLIYKRQEHSRHPAASGSYEAGKHTVRYLGIEVDDALEIAEQTEI